MFDYLINNNIDCSEIPEHTDLEFDELIDEKLIWYRYFLLEKTKLVINSYWNEHRIQYNTHTKPYKHNFTWIGPRLIYTEKGDTYSINWYVFKKDDEGNTVSEYIKKGKSLRYSHKILKKKAEHWEIELVLEFENIFYFIRNSLKKYSELKRISKAYFTAYEIFLYEIHNKTYIDFTETRY